MCDNDGPAELLNLLVTVGHALMVARRRRLSRAAGRARARHGEPAGDDPWDGQTLEWVTTSPAPDDNFVEMPTVMSPEPVLDLRAAPTRERSLMYAPARRPGPAAAPPGARRHGARPASAMLMLTGGMLAHLDPHARAGARRRRSWVPKGITIPEVPSNVMLIGVLAARACSPSGRSTRPAERDRGAHRPGARARRPVRRSRSSTPRRTSTPAWRCRSPTSGYAGMFYAITGTMLALLFIVGSCSRRSPPSASSVAATDDQELVAAHALYWYVMAAVFSAVWLIVYVTK